MSLPLDEMEHLLAELGRAAREGAFDASATMYPWRTAEPEAPRFTHRRFAWMRVAVPLAAAAVVAVLFVGPSLWHLETVREVAENVAATDSSTAKSEQPAVPAEPVLTTTHETLDCDYNGDGQVDGNDIQAFVNQLRDTKGDPILEAEYLKRCLLGN